MTLPESWDPIAIQLGYKTEAEMLVDMYVAQNLSVSQMVKKLGYAQNSIRTRLVEAGIVLRARGGPNSQGHTLLKDLPDAELMKLRPMDCLKHNCSPTTIYKEKVRRKLITPKESTTPCSLPVSPLSPTLTNTPEEVTSNSVSLKSQCETLNTSNGISEDEKQEILSSLITELTKGS